MTAPTDRRLLVTRLFEAWSSRDPDRLQPLFHPDATFFDSVNGEFRGWPAIRDFYQRSLRSWSRMDTVPTRIWVEGDTAALTWTMEGEIIDDRFGADLIGSTCRISGMAWVRFDGDLVIHDEEYFDRGAPAAVKSTTQRSTPTEVATAFFAALNAHDLDRASEFLDDDIVYSNGIGFAELHGIAQFRYIWEPVLNGPPTRMQIRNVIAGERIVAVEREDVQTRTTPDGSEREIRLPGVACLEVNHEGKITAWRDYYDMEAWCRLLGRPYDHFQTWFQLASQVRPGA